MQPLDPTTGEISKVYLFVACLPFSRYEFVEASLDMRQESWLRAHAAMFTFFGGTVPRLVPDNLKTEVISHPREGEIVLNETYREMVAPFSHIGSFVDFRVTDTILEVRRKTARAGS